MTKLCTKCKLELNETDFNWKFKNIKRSAHCRNCSREYVKQHYKNNLSYYLKKALKRNLYLKKMHHKYVGNYLKTHACVDCGENDILVLEFDHKSRKTKTIEISKLVNQGLSMSRMIEEVSKCEVRCANCHRRKTALEDNSWRLKYAPVA